MTKFFSILAGSALLLASCTSQVSQKQNTELVTQFVDPFIGTADHGHTYPGAAYPFGQIQLSPDNGTDRKSVV